jgi:pimeloyl-ACP methyl ester carboxylesterase
MQTLYVLGHSWGSRVALQFSAQYCTRILGCFVEDEIIGPDLKKGPPKEESDINTLYKETKEKWDKFAPHQFNSEEEVVKFYETVAGPPKTFGFPNYSRKIASKEIVVEGGDQRKTVVYFPLFKPHVAFAFDEYARVADMNFVWKDFKSYPFLIHICCGDGEENGADVSKEEFAKLFREATVEMAGHRRSVSLIKGSGHVIHRDFQDLFLMDFQQFVAKANG